MNSKEVRMRCIEALSSMGVRSANDLITQAKVIEEWVAAAPEPVTQVARKVPPSSADKG